MAPMDGRVAAIVLGPGAGSRFGGGKLLATVEAGRSSSTRSTAWPTRASTTSSWSSAATPPRSRGRRVADRAPGRSTRARARAVQLAGEGSAAVGEAPTTVLDRARRPADRADGRGRCLDAPPDPDAAGRGAGVRGGTAAATRSWCAPRASRCWTRRAATAGSDRSSPRTPSGSGGRGRGFEPGRGYARGPGRRAGNGAGPRASGRIASRSTGSARSPTGRTSTRRSPGCSGPIRRGPMSRRSTRCWRWSRTRRDMARHRGGRGPVRAADRRGARAVGRLGLGDRPVDGMLDALREDAAGHASPTSGSSEGRWPPPIRRAVRRDVALMAHWATTSRPSGRSSGDGGGTRRLASRC